MDDTANPVEAFIARWQGADGRERANYQLFLSELAALLEVPAPEPATADDAANAYVFERRVVFRHGDGSESYGYIDLYRRGAFVLEAKDVREISPTRYDEGMLRARSQAENYARALPAGEGRPPFVVVVDVGRSIELYSEFSRSGATYTPFPDPRSHRIRLDELRDEAIRARLRRLWLEPLALDPARRSAIVTREIAAHLAELARSLESAGHPAHTAAGFLTRCLFTMFAEDVALIPRNAFRSLLESLKTQPAEFVPMVGELWRAMDAGLFSVAIRADLLRFNGKLFKHPEVLALDRAQIELLIEAARADWKEVEPAIFGTLLERALDPTERHALGAHYTPRAYVERLVLPTVIEPLREDWKIAQASALMLAAEGKQDAALASIVAFHQALCAVRVLDPACGSGNFLYVTLEHMKRLEGEVLNAFDELDPAGQAVRLRQGDLALDGGRVDPFGGQTVDPHQLLGLELNPRAAAIAELVLWIGYLQWHNRTRGAVLPPEPVLKDFRNIECRDAVLAWDSVDYATDSAGRPLTRWDGRTFKTSPVTGEPVPDETARVPQERYLGARRAAWPEADFVVGNPPFIGKGRIRDALGDGYVEALRASWPQVPESADFVMYWWHHAATLTRHGALRRFGLITTNSLRQTFNRRVVEAALDPSRMPSPGRTPESSSATPSSRRRPGSILTSESTMDSGLRRNDELGETQPLSLVFAIPDHPWVDAADGAAVRIAMTVGAVTQTNGRLLEVIAEHPDENGEVAVNVCESHGSIHSNIRIGSNLSTVIPLKSNLGLSNTGFILGGRGFVLKKSEAKELGTTSSDVSCLLYPLRNGEDLLGVCRDLYVIDANGLSESELRAVAPQVWQRLRDRVYPERQTNRDQRVRERWWLFRRSNEQLRSAIQELARTIVTVETAKHRVFQFIATTVRAEHVNIVIALDDAVALGVLSSAVHVVWALATGGTLEDRPRYNKTRCFDPFPFPAASEAQAARIRTLAEQLDAHRKRQQAAHAGLTLTGMYNVLEKLRSGEALSAKERATHEQGLVSVLRQFHDELDFAVLDAYGWNDLAPLLAAAHAVPPPANAYPVGRGYAPDGAAHDRAASVGHIGPTYESERPVGRGYVPDGPAHDRAASVGHIGPTYASERPVGRGYVPDGSAHDRAASVGHIGPTCESERPVGRGYVPDGPAHERTASTYAPGDASSGRAQGALLPAGGSMDRAEAARAFDEAILERLVALNAARAAEEARGRVRWLRPDFQNPQGERATDQLAIDDIVAAPTAAATKKHAWPKDLPDQVRAVADLLARAGAPLDEADIAERFSARGRWRDRLPVILDTLVAIGRARREEGGRYGAA